MPRNKRSSARMMSVPPVDRRFRNTFFFVEASSFEKHYLWKEWHEKVNWEQDHFGWSCPIGTLDRRPIHLTFFWARIEGKLVGFWECTSEVADHKLIERWLRKYCSPMLPGGREARVNANNFHICIQEIQRVNALKLALTTA